MSNQKVLKGAVLVGLGAISYGMLATFVKIAYGQGFTISEVIISQFTYGIFAMLGINLYQKLTNKTVAEKPTKKNVLQLLLAGTSLGLTSVFYYLAIKYIPVSIAIILLMQTVWMGVLLESILDKKWPSMQKLIAVLVVLVGTLLATNLFEMHLKIDWRGMFLGILSAASFTATMFTSNRIAIHITTTQRSLYMLLGGAVIVFSFAYFTSNSSFNYHIFLSWGIVVSLFGTIIPPLLFTAGFPKTGIGIGSIVASLELPVSVLMAYFLLHENVNFLQWVGIILIILAIVIMNINFKKR